jgi:glycogenin glucosyltransferase
MADWVEVRTPKHAINVGDAAALASVSEALAATLREQHPALLEQADGRHPVAYATLASPDYEWGLRILLRSLRRVSKVPVIVLAAQRWEFDCPEERVVFLEVPKLSNSDYQPDRREFGVVLTKLWIFALTDFRRVTYVDADSLVLRSLDDLFDFNGLWASADFTTDSDKRDFNSGLISFEPTRELRDHVFERAGSTASFDHADQGLLNALLWERARVLPPEYSLLRHFHYFAGAELKRDRVRAIHYIVKKPWELWYREIADGVIADLDDLWTSQLTREELLGLIASWRRRQFVAERVRFEGARKETKRRRNRLLFIMGGLLIAAAFFAAGVLIARSAG